MTSISNDGSRALQDRFDARRLADRLEERIVHPRLSEDQQAFVESVDCFFLATADADGQADLRVALREVFPNCPRYIHRRTLVARSEFVPRQGCDTPVPDWKRSSLANDVLPEGDPARLS